MKYLTYLILLIFILTSCGSHKSNDPVATEPPQAVGLVYPDQNSICISGNVISGTQSSVQLKWNGAANASSYDITVKNLLTGDSLVQTTSQTQISFTLSRNTPFSWYVISKSDKISQTAKSSIWKFYNSGNGITSYAPFPADNMNPAPGQYITVNSGTITLSWTGSDPDNDIATYDVYFGASATPPLYAKDITTTNLSNVPLTPKAKYYWQVITKDKNNNTSSSGIVQFSTN